MNILFHLPLPANLKVIFENFQSCGFTFSLVVLSQEYIRICFTNWSTDFISHVELTSGFIVTGFTKQVKKTYHIIELWQLFNIVGHVNELIIDVDNNSAKMGGKTCELTHVDDSNVDIHNIELSEIPMNQLESKEFMEMVNRFCLFESPITVRNKVWSTENKLGESLTEHVLIHSNHTITVPIKYLKICSLCCKMSSKCYVGISKNFLLLTIDIIDGFQISSIIGTCIE